MAAATPATPSAREFARLAREHSLVPVYRTVTADLETPVSAFLRIAAKQPEAFLLESVEGGEHVGRYTFIGIEPYKKIVSRGANITVEEASQRRTFQGDIFAELKQALSGHTPARLAGLPPSVIERAKAILTRLAGDDASISLPSPQARPKRKITVAPDDKDQLDLL